MTSGTHSLCLNIEIEIETGMLGRGVGSEVGYSITVLFIYFIVCFSTLEYKLPYSQEFLLLFIALSPAPGRISYCHPEDEPNNQENLTPDSCPAVPSFSLSTKHNCVNTAWPEEGWNLLLVQGAGLGPRLAFPQ